MKIFYDQHHFSATASSMHNFAHVLQAKTHVPLNINTNFVAYLGLQENYEMLQALWHLAI